MARHLVRSLLLVAACIVACDPDRGRDPTTPPKTDETDPTGAQGAPVYDGSPPAVVAPQATTPSPFPDTEIGRMLTDHLKAAHEVGPGADEYYQASLQTLQAQGEAVVAELVASYRRLPEQDYAGRQMLVAMLADLRVPAAIAELAAIAKADLAERRPVAAHMTDPWEEEVLVRVSAIRGLGRMVSDVAAQDHLFGLLDSGSAELAEQAAWWLQLDPQYATQLRERIPRHLWLYPLERVTPPAPQQTDATPAP